MWCQSPPLQNEREKIEKGEEWERGKRIGGTRGVLWNSYVHKARHTLDHFGSLWALCWYFLLLINLYLGALSVP